ncbi:MAG: uroporphyrinogen decarboxylase family protein [Anaerolineae bacterium]|jgi:uroporphyrinogen decarboxylase|nr:uroporphyrinogen-III decarboxylase-like protein [Chloroflexota bacterium]
MPRETMTPRERWQAVLSSKLPDRVPTDYWTTNEAHQRLKAYLGIDDEDALLERLHIDRPLTVGPRYTGPAIPDNKDVFGITYRYVDYGAGSYREAVTNPLADFGSVEEIQANYRWPDPDWWSYDHLPEAIRGRERWPIRGGGSEPFLTYKDLRGDEQAYMDLVLNPEIVHYCLDKLFELAYQNTLRIYEAIPGQVLLTYVAEDLGSQSSLLFSPTQIRTFLLPRMRRMMRLAHEAGAYVFFHSDGAVRPILPDMISTGIDILNPIQWRCPGMERAPLKADFGTQLVLHGAMDNQQTLPFGTVEQVREEVRENIATLGANGGYVLAPCHNIQPVSPPENTVAMYDEAYRSGWY